MNAKQTAEALKQLAESPILGDNLSDITRADIAQFDALRCQVQMGLSRVGCKARFLIPADNGPVVEMYGYTVAYNYMDKVLSFVACDEDYSHGSIVLPPIKVSILNELQSSEQLIGAGPYVEPIYIYRAALL